MHQGGSKRPVEIVGWTYDLICGNGHKRSDQLPEQIVESPVPDTRVPLRHRLLLGQHSGQKRAFVHKVEVAPTWLIKNRKKLAR